jgi:dTDP-4-amino-4,6-dideoxygalactose transaminase
MGAWYGYKPHVDEAVLGVSRERLVAALKAEGLDVDIPGTPALHTFALFEPHRFLIGSFSKHDNRSSQYPGADTYHRDLLSLPTPTGARDEAMLQLLIEGFQKVWRHLEELR